MEEKGIIAVQHWSDLQCFIENSCSTVKVELSFHFSMKDFPVVTIAQVIGS